MAGALAMSLANFARQPATAETAPVALTPVAALNVADADQLVSDGTWVYATAGASIVKVDPLANKIAATSEPIQTNWLNIGGSKPGRLYVQWASGLSKLNADLTLSSPSTAAGDYLRDMAVVGTESNTDERLVGFNGGGSLVSLPVVNDYSAPAMATQIRLSGASKVITLVHGLVQGSSVLYTSADQVLHGTNTMNGMDDWTAGFASPITADSTPPPLTTAGTSVVVASPSELKTYDYYHHLSATLSRDKPATKVVYGASEKRVYVLASSGYGDPQASVETYDYSTSPPTKLATTPAPGASDLLRVPGTRYLYVSSPAQGLINVFDTAAAPDTPADPDPVVTDPAPVVANPVLTASVTGRRGHAGWYVSPVTATFACRAGSAPLTRTCPSPVALGEGSHAAFTRSIDATDGGAASATVGPIRVDLTAPSVRIKHVVAKRLYRNRPKKVTCLATDALSGATCALTTRKQKATLRVHGNRVKVYRVTWKAVATDGAGHTSSTATKAYVRR